MRSLVVEDEPLARAVLVRALLPYGAVDEAADGIAGLRAFHDALGSSAPYDLVCLDIDLPGADGHAVLRDIRLSELRARTARAAAVVMTSGHADARHVLAAFRGQCEAYLVKPIDPQAISAQLLRLGLAAAKAPHPHPHPGRHP